MNLENLFLKGDDDNFAAHLQRFAMGFQFEQVDHIHSESGKPIVKGGPLTILRSLDINI